MIVNSSKSQAVNYIGSVNTLPQNTVIGEMCHCTSTGYLYISDGTTWQKIDNVDSDEDKYTIIDVLNKKFKDITLTDITSEEVLNHPMVVENMNKVLSALKQLELSIKLVHE